MAQLSQMHIPLFHLLSSFDRLVCFYNTIYFAKGMFHAEPEVTAHNIVISKR